MYPKTSNVGQSHFGCCFHSIDFSDGVILFVSSRLLSASGCVMSLVCVCVCVCVWGLNVGTALCVNMFKDTAAWSWNTVVWYDFIIDLIVLHSYVQHCTCLL
ncbi:hypothetical protein NQD34_004703 [Periophthalmus magnuspinnatus]|nr:hypothetical protein NQD34_004703 [Periophthalmus magnuspinnatus]